MKKHFLLFPNPEDGVINILVATPKAGEFELVITDLTGKVARRQRERFTEGKTGERLMCKN